jgi:uncharacterized protein YdeI (YjbR/CyaY-like superfamily)
MDGMERVEIASADELWRWLDANHARPDGVLLVTWKAAHRDRHVGREAILDALVAHGWTDGRRFKLDAERTMQLIAPRRQAHWAQSYKDRAERLEAEGRMRPAGRASVAAAKARGGWDALDPVDALEAPGDLTMALDARDAGSWFAAAAPSYRRNVLRWIASAKKPETRIKRVATVADHAARGEKVPNY